VDNDKEMSILLELFDKHADYEWTSLMGVPAATFKVEDVPYLVAFMPYESNFMDDSKSGLPRKYETIMGAMIANYEQGDLVSGNYLIGTGNEFMVFATAIKIFEDFLQKEQPEVFAVAALIAEGRDVTYSKMAKRVAMRMKKSGYTLVEEETMNGTQFGPMHVFYVLRNDLKEEWLDSQGETLGDSGI
jgi:hypothetical protein